MGVPAHEREGGGDLEYALLLGLSIPIGGGPTTASRNSTSSTIRATAEYDSLDFETFLTDMGTVDCRDINHLSGSLDVRKMCSFT